MNICIVCEGYPYPGIPQFPFVEQFCIELANQGHDVTVIAPQSITKKIIRKTPYIPYRRVEKVSNGNVIEIYVPKYVSFGNLKLNGKSLYFSAISSAIVKTLKKIIKNKRIDVCYGHFWHMAASVYPIVRKYNIPLFVASGESAISVHHLMKQDQLKELSNYVKGVICVSSKNKKESIEKCFVKEKKCNIFPNGIDNKLFFFENSKIKIRKSLGYSVTDFIIAFTGAFIERKGANRVAQAIEHINDEHIKSIFIGGPVSNNKYGPDCKGILHKGPLNHNLIPRYLNCADVFVLPTLAEGCCNAIIEAMACGLPIISSDRSFNYDILDDTNAILINPENIEELALAIKTLKEDKRRLLNMSLSSLNKSKQLNIITRTENIVNYIKSSL